LASRDPESEAGGPKFDGLLAEPFWSQYPPEVTAGIEMGGEILGGSEVLLSCEFRVSHTTVTPPPALRHGWGIAGSQCLNQGWWSQ